MGCVILGHGCNSDDDCPELQTCPIILHGGIRCCQAPEWPTYQPTVTPAYHPVYTPIHMISEDLYTITEIPFEEDDNSAESAAMSVPDETLLILMLVTLCLIALTLCTILCYIYHLKRNIKTVTYEPVTVEDKGSEGCYRSSLD